MGRAMKSYIVFMLIIGWLPLSATIFDSANLGLASSQVAVSDLKSTNRHHNLLEASSRQRGAVKELARDLGLSEALSVLEYLEMPLTGDTHLLVHEIGASLYDRYGIEGLRFCTDSLLMACYHGLVIRAVGANGEQATGKILDECKLDYNVLIQCAHAIGHGYLAWSSYSLLDALQLCDSLPDEIRYNCHDGTFMENIYRVFLDGMPPSQWHPQNDEISESVCSTVPVQYHVACYANEPSKLIQEFQADLRKVGEVCRNLTKTAVRDACYDGTARLIHTMSYGDTDRAITLCGRLPSEVYDKCLATIARSANSMGDSRMSSVLCELLPERLAHASCHLKLSRPPKGEAQSISMTLSKFRGAQVEKQHGILNAVIRLGGIPSGLRLLHDAFGAEPWAAHHLAHYVGIVAYRDMGLDALQVCNGTSSFGCYHGVITTHFHTIGGDIEETESRCARAVNDVSVRSCIHGIGHGLLELESDALTSLQLCDKLDEQVQQNCYSGVLHLKTVQLLEAAAIGSSNEDKSMLTLGCTDLPMRYQAACLYQEPAVLLPRFHNDFGTVGNVCGQIGGSELAEMCFRGLGGQAVFAAKANPARIVALCRVIQDGRAIDICLTHSSRELVFVGSPGAELVCNAIHDSRSQRSCYEEVRKATLTSSVVNDDSRLSVATGKAQILQAQGLPYSSPYSSPYTSPPMYLMPYSSPYSPYMMPYSGPYSSPPPH